MTMVSFELAWVRANPSVLQGLDWQLPVSEPVVATVRMLCPCHDEASAVVPAGNSPLVKTAKATAGNDISALRPMRAATFLSPVI
jgi:hypothetical protein